MGAPGPPRWGPGSQRPPAQPAGAIALRAVCLQPPVARCALGAVVFSCTAVRGHCGGEGPAELRLPAGPARRRPAADQPAPGENYISQEPPRPPPSVPNLRRTKPACAAAPVRHLRLAELRPQDGACSRSTGQPLVIFEGASKTPAQQPDNAFHVNNKTHFPSHLESTLVEL